MILFITKQARLTDKEFQDYYETTHAPLSRRLFPMVGDYRRNFIDKTALIWREGENLPTYDVITEMSFDTLEDYQSFRQEIARPEVISQVRADEANFLETQAPRRLIVIEGDKSLQLHQYVLISDGR